jgi:uncharacterized protein (TIGR02271 family)
MESARSYRFVDVPGSFRRCHPPEWIVLVARRANPTQPCGLRSACSPPEKQMGNTPSDPNTTIELAEETLSVSKRRVETGRVRVRIRTESEETQANASLFDQDVDISRVPIGRDVTEVPAVRQEGDVTIYPVLEEVLVVEKRLVLKEEVHVRRVVSQTEVSQPVTLRRQWADVERTAGNNEDQVKE